MLSLDLFSPREGAHRSGQVAPRERTSTRRPRPHVTEPVVTLGLSVLPGTTELVVVRGRTARGAVLDRVVTAASDGVSAQGLRVQDAVDSVLQTQALAIAHGYHVHAVGVTGDGVGNWLTDGLIMALEDAGLTNVTALDPAVGREVFTQPEVPDTENVATSRAQSRTRRRWMFVAAMTIAVSALAFAVVDRLDADRRPGPELPAVTPPPGHPVTPKPPAVETLPPPAPAPSSIPAPEAPPSVAPVPAYQPPRQAPVQQQPAHSPAPAPAPPPAEPPEADPSDNCMFLCGVSI